MSKTEGMVTVLHAFENMQTWLEPTCKNLFREQSGMPATAVARGLWTSENAGVLSREYVMALSTAQITNTNSTAWHTCSKLVFQALDLRQLKKLTSEDSSS